MGLNITLASRFILNAVFSLFDDEFDRQTKNAGKQGEENDGMR